MVTFSRQFENSESTSTTGPPNRVDPIFPLILSLSFIDSRAVSIIVLDEEGLFSFRSNFLKHQTSGRTRLVENKPCLIGTM